jgi:hypothetical protein
VAVSSERGNEPSVSIKGEGAEFLDNLSNSAPCSWLGFRVS